MKIREIRFSRIIINFNLSCLKEQPMKKSDYGLNLSCLIIVLVMILIGFEVGAAEKLPQNRVMSAPTNTTMKITITPVEKVNSHEVTITPSTTTQAIPGSKAKKIQAVVTKISGPIQINQVSNNNLSQIKIGPAGPQIPISHEQGRPALQYKITEGSTKPVNPESTQHQAAVRPASIRVWRFDESGKRIEIQDGLKVLEGPVQ